MMLKLLGEKKREGGREVGGERHAVIFSELFATLKKHSFLQRDFHVWKAKGIS